MAISRLVKDTSIDSVELHVRDVLYEDGDDESDHRYVYAYHGVDDPAHERRSLNSLVTWWYRLVKCHVMCVVI